MVPVLTLPGHRGVWVGAALVAALAVVLIVPDTGPAAWVAFATSSALVAFALVLIPDGVGYGAAALFGTVALKEGLPVVADASIGVFHVVAVALGLAWVVQTARERLALGGCADAVGAHRFGRLTSYEWILAGAFLAGLWSLPMSLHKTKTLIYSGRLLFLWAVAVLVSRSLQSERSRRRALAWFVAGSVFATVVGLAQWAGFDIGNTAVHGNAFDGAIIVRPAAFYLDPNFLGVHLVLGVTGGLALAFRRGRSWWWLAAVVPMLAATAVTYSRSSWIALGVGLLTCVVFGPRELRMRLLAVMAAAGVIGALIVGPASLGARIGSIFDLGSGSSSATRLLMAEATVDMIEERPFFGTGLEAFQEAYSVYRKPGARVEISHPHQVPLTLIAETGVAGLIAQVTLLAAVLNAHRRRARARRTDVDVALLAGLFVMIVTAVFQFVLYFEPAWLYAGLLGSGLVVLDRGDGRAGSGVTTAKA